MNFRFFIAKRYFFTKKNSNFVHIISWVSLLGVAIGTAALILILSVFNGFEALVLKMYNSFDPHLQITAAEGKVFNPEEISAVLDNPEFESSTYILEEKVLLKYQEKEFIATVKGVSQSYPLLFRKSFPKTRRVDETDKEFDKRDEYFDSLLVVGEFLYSFENKNVAVIGSGVAYYLSIGLGTMLDPFNPHLQVFVPNRNSKTLLNPQTAFQYGRVSPVGIFSIQAAEIDQEYIITSLAFIQQLADRGNSISAVEIKLKNEDGMRVIQEQLAAALGDDFIVKNRLEQQEFLYKIFKAEGLVVFLILTFIMIIATFNIIGALSMLMLDKQKDITTLRSLGCTVQDIQSVFFRKSMLTILLGIGTGLFLGLGLAFLQQTFGFIEMCPDCVIKAFPVAIVFTDIILVSFTVFAMGMLASWYPAKMLSSKLFKN